MKTLAFTIAYKETHWLDMWIEYYLSHCDKVMVLDQGGNTITTAQDKRLEVVEFYPEFVGNWVENIRRVNDARAKASEEFDVTLFVDVDEFLVPDPDYHENLKMYLRLNRRKVVYAYGWDVLGFPYDAPLHWSYPLLSQREWMVFNRLYCKPSVMNEYMPLAEGGHHLAKGDRRNANNTDNTLWLFHMKMADWGEYKRRQANSHEPVKDHVLADGIRSKQKEWKSIPPRFFDCL